MPKLSVIPTCIFRGIDVNKLITSYNEGKYKDLQMPVDKIKVDTNVYDLYGDSPYDHIYSMTDGNQVQTVICTINHKPFTIAYNRWKSSLDEDKSFLDILANEDTDKNYEGNHRCRNCLKDFTHRPRQVPFKSESVMIYNDKTDDYMQCTVYHVSGPTFCDYPCVLSHIRHQKSVRYDFRDSRYIKAEDNLQMMYREANPDSCFLQEANEPGVIEFNAGWMKPVEYATDKYVYHKTGNLIIMPCKEELKRTLKVKP